MDGGRFDGLSKALSTRRAGPGTRRGLLRWLATLTVAGAGLGWIDEEGAANRPGKHRRAHNRRHSGHRKDNRKKEHAEEDDENDARQDQCKNRLLGAGCYIYQSRDEPYYFCPPGTNLQGKDLHGCVMPRAQLEGVMFNADDIGRIPPTSFQSANLQGANLNGAQGVEANFDHADLRGGATMFNAQFSGARFTSASLDGADFTGTTLRGANLFHANLTGAIMQDADLRQVTWRNTTTGATCPDGTTLDFFSARTCCGHLNGYTTPFC